LLRLSINNKTFYFSKKSIKLLAKFSICVYNIYGNIYAFSAEGGRFLMYKIGDQIAHPLHGAGTISAIESRRINGTNRDYYLMHIPVGDMTVMIPTETCTIIGIRPVIDSEKAEAILASIPQIEITDNTNWNKRYRENMVRIKSGDLLEVAAVIKSLVYRDNERGLSTGERKMLHSAKQIFISELVIAQSIAYEEAEQRLYSAIG